MHRFFTCSALVAAAATLTASAHGQEEEAPPAAPAPAAPAPPPAAEPTPPPPPTEAPKEEKSAIKLTAFGFVEAYYAHNFNRPSNAITNARGFDNRHATFSLANALLGANWEAGPVDGRLALQVGSTPSTYYGAEPALPGTSAANATGPELWKYLQEAFVAWRAPVGRGLRIQLGLTASPIGFESLAVKDNWNWSRSNLFFGLPFYHTGIRATYGWTDALTTTASVFNGWNSVVDNNEAKSVQADVTYKRDGLTAKILYFGGIERPTGAPEGPWWRHHLDVTGTVDPTRWLSFGAQGDYGWEPNRIGRAYWIAGALYTRVKPVDRVYVVLRGDRLQEHLATAPGRFSSNALFFGGTEWVTSATATLDVRPHDVVSVRLEYRHDVAETPLFFGTHTVGSGSAIDPYVPRARTQDTLLLGATAWF